MTQYLQNQPADLGEIDLKKLILVISSWFKYIKSKSLTIFILGSIGGLIGYGYAYFQKPTYQATLSFALEDEKSGSGSFGGGALGIASSLGLDLGTSGGGAFSGANLIELMTSRRLVEKTLLDSVNVNNESISLAEMYIRFNGWREIWQKKQPDISKKLQFPVGLDRKKFTLQQDSLLGQIYRKLVSSNLVVKLRDKKLSIINIDVITENELFSKLFAEILAKEVSDFYIDTKSRKAKMNVQILEKHADSIRMELNNAITGVAVATDNTYNLNPALNIKRTPSTRRQVDVQANTAILTELVKNLELAKVTLRKETPLIQIIDTPILPLLKEKKSKLIFLIRGGLIFSLISVLFLSIRRWWNNLTIL